jgi:hypothetical protein
MGLVETIGSATALAASAGHFLEKDVAVVKQVASEFGIDLGELGHVCEHGPLEFKARTTSH